MQARYSIPADRHSRRVARAAQTWRLRCGAFIVLAAASVSGAAADIPGVIVRVPSGNNLVLYTGVRHLNVTLVKATAPAMQTPLGTRARDALARLCHGASATLVATGTAPDGSTLGQVSCAGRDAAEELVRLGLAKVNEPYAKFDSVLIAAEQDARAARAGVWAGQ
jgi:endonuclease YncB( thermonuclease family)